MPTKTVRVDMVKMLWLSVVVEEGGKSGKRLKGEWVAEGNLWDTEAWCMPDSEGTMPSQST